MQAETGTGEGRGVPEDSLSPLALSSKICFYGKALSKVWGSWELC